MKHLFIFYLCHSTEEWNLNCSKQRLLSISGFIAVLLHYPNLNHSIQTMHSKSYPNEANTNQRLLKLSLIIIKQSNKATMAHQKSWAVSDWTILKIFVKEIEVPVVCGPCFTLSRPDSAWWDFSTKFYAMYFAEQQIRKEIIENRFQSIRHLRNKTRNVTIC